MNRIYVNCSPAESRTFFCVPGYCIIWSLLELLAGVDLKQSCKCVIFGPYVIFALIFYSQIKADMVFARIDFKSLSYKKRFDVSAEC